MVSAGIFRLRDNVYIDAMPVHNASGLWQAWKMPDGLFMVQPLDQDRMPWGTVYLLEAQEVGVMLAPVEETGGKAKQDSASEPDLLAVWYEQARKEEEALRGVRSAQDAPDARPPTPPATFSKARTSSDEPQLTPFWHPDEFLDDEEPPLSLPQSRPPARRTAPRPAAPAPDRRAGARPDDAITDDDLFSDIYRQPTVDGQKASPAYRQPPAGGQKASPPAEKSGAGAVEFRDDDSYAEVRAQQLEQRMRDEFDALMEKLDRGGVADAEREVSRLILRGAGFSWKQKYMFTEFGFALRRRKLYKLALASHMRALGFAPADEHILFNVARSEYELGKVDAAKNYLVKALEVNPAFSAAGTFLAFLEGGVKKLKATPPK
jgi:hypothetical protein